MKVFEMWKKWLTAGVAGVALLCSQGVHAEVPSASSVMQFLDLLDGGVSQKISKSTTWSELLQAISSGSSMNDPVQKMGREMSREMEVNLREELKDMSPEVQAEAQLEIERLMLLLVQNSLSFAASKEMVNLQVKGYQNVYTQEEMNALIGLVQTPEGRSIVGKYMLPISGMSEMRKEVQVRNRKKFQELWQAMAMVRKKYALTK